MDEAILTNINRVVRQSDSLYILGDFSFRACRHVRDYLQRIHCQNVHLVRGNHDDARQIHTAGFKWVKDYHEIHYNKERYVLSHYPMRSWNARYHGSFHLYGHVHGNEPDVPGERSWNVGVDVTGFHPVPLEEARAKMLVKCPKAPKEMSHSVETPVPGD